MIVNHFVLAPCRPPPPPRCGKCGLSCVL